MTSFGRGLRIGGWAGAIWLAACGFAVAQLIIPHDESRNFRLPRPLPPQVRPEISYRISEMEVDTSIRDQIAQTRLTQTFENTRDQVLEAVFVFPLPADGAIEDLTMLVDGKELVGRILPAGEARGIYESYVRRFRDPALLEWLGHGMFQTSVFPLPPHTQRKVVISYSQVLKKNEKAIDFAFPLAMARYSEVPLEKLRFRVAVEASNEIKNIYCPTHNVEVQRDDARHAIVRMESHNVVPSDDFRLIFDTAEGEVGGELLSYWPAGEKEGYFVFLASPNYLADNQTVAQKTLNFVIDRSGSMSGEKIEQAREAAKFVINHLQPGDLFNIVVYDDHVESFRPELQRFNEETRSAALGFINGINAGGSTNIDQALQTALGQMHAGADTPYVLFLTDGLPTAGETNEMQIAKNAQQRNQSGARIVCFGVGYDVNSRLLDRLARDQHGQSEYVRPQQNIEEAVSRLYRKIAAPVLTGVQIAFTLPDAKPEDGPAVDRFYPSGTVDLFRGEQLVVVGRYRHAGPGQVVLLGTVDKQPQKFQFDVRFAAPGETPQNRFAAKLWASRRIGEIIDQIDLEGKNSELIEELVRLSQQHGILTPYTSFLADEQQDPRQLSRLSDNARVTQESLSALDPIAGNRADSFEQRAAKGRFKRVDNLAQSDDASAAGSDSGGGSSVSANPMPAAGIFRQQGQTVYRRGKLMIATNAIEVDLERDREQIVTVAQFSDEYFKLVQANTAEENQILAAQLPETELIVRLRGKIYRIQ